jgi:hypothetical protein
VSPEYLVWTDVLVDNNFLEGSRLRDLLKADNEILSIVIASAKTARFSSGA